MTRFLFIALFPLFLNCNSKSEPNQTKVENYTGIEDTWDVYMAMYEKGAGSTTLNMDLIKSAPDKDLPFIVITGVLFTNCANDGFPNKSEFDKLYTVSDDVQKVMSELTKFKLAGTFTYQCERTDYIYVEDTSGIRKKLTDLYLTKHNNYQYRIDIKKDDNWDAYKKFLYPNEETQEYMSNQKVVMQLESGGDHLTEARQVDHWIYFNNLNNRNEFEKKVVNIGFKIESKEFADSTLEPYSLHISRVDKVDLISITKVTLDLRKKAKELNGNYDGWETYILRK